MPELTKEQWDQIERALSWPLASVELKADGYDITLKVLPYKALSQRIVVYVDGWCRPGEWAKGGPPEAQKFCQEKRAWVHPAKHRENAKKQLKRLNLDNFSREHYQRVADSCISFWTPIWTSPKSLFRHMRKTCTDIEIVSTSE